MSLTAAEIETMLDEARAARHSLALGQAVAEVWRDGRRLTFTRATMPQLDSYIRVLENDLVAAQATTAGTARRRPIGLAWRN